MVVGHGGDNNWGQNSMREQNKTYIQINTPAPTKRGGLQGRDTRAGGQPKFAPVTWRGIDSTG
jgi:hypothetical protein